MNNQAAKLVKTTAQLSLKFIQLRISGSSAGCAPISIARRSYAFQPPASPQCGTV